MNIQNLQRKDGTLLTVTQRVAIHYENPIKFLIQSIESSLCDCSDAYLLVTGNINVAGANDNTKVALKNCALFRKCTTEINGTHIEETEHNCATKIFE